MRPRFAETQNHCNCTALRKASRRVSQLYDEALARSGLRVTQLAILNQILRMGTPAMGELARALVMDRGALAHNVKPLERDGLIETVPDPADRRNRLIALTRAGRKKILESESAWARAQECFEASFGAKQSVALRRALALIASDGFLEAFQRPMKNQKAGTDRRSGEAGSQHSTRKNHASPSSGFTRTRP